jgi:adenosylcobinamide-GDP ribazoletransferase
VTEAHGALPPPVRGVRAAFASWTRLPVGGFPYRPVDFAWASAHAPLVGAVVGMTVAVTFCALAPLGADAAALLAIAASLLVTGAFHEDGLADTCDALGGGMTRERIFAILKDSRIGAYGGAALVFSIVARALLVARLGPHAPWAVPVAFATARVCPVWQMAALAYVTPETTSKSRDLVRGGAHQVAVATIWGAAILGVAARLGVVPATRILPLGVMLVLVTALSGWHYSRRAGGVTGDFLGATEQLAELGALVVFAWNAA